MVVVVTGGAAPSRLAVVDKTLSSFSIPPSATAAPLLSGINDSIGASTIIPDTLVVKVLIYLSILDIKIELSYLFIWITAAVVVIIACCLIF